MNILSKLFSKGASEILSKSNDIIDGLSTTDHEKLKAKNELSQIVLGSLNEVQNAQKEIIVTEAQGNWLQRSWRPLVMLSFTFIVIYTYFIQHLFSIAPQIELPDKFWGLLEVGLGGYVIGRSVEKVATSVTQNVDLTFLKKKERKNNIYG
ncbi:3TM-type holin [Aureibacter tunicatorum]|uniref:Holin of 3TMs, for gene-transfer release n=1 Tax=Aureibacter tunicatorum TaxID=866807 RepID=A0AAE3XIY3_9BACT|nr:3TM-type holin [Aureibacter tunicatorum]MDR6238596.1 hypothetical protein [Aureibacter tunicatorum]BDD05473.1 hypothetical protein AUTU_29560 [Aureibacter tunicatorum]